MIQEINSYCSPSEINDCVSDGIKLLQKTDWTAQPHFNSSIGIVDKENKGLSLSIGTVRSSKYAALLEEADDLRDRLLTGLTKVTKASMLRGDNSVAESATEAYRTIEAHGLGLKRKGYQSESAGIDSLTHELSSEKMKPVIDVLPESKAFLLELIPANEEFKALFDENMAYKAELEKLNSPTVQKKVVSKLFNTKIVRFLNLMAEIEPDTFAEIAKLIAPYTERINLTAKVRRSRKEQEEQELSTN